MSVPLPPASIFDERNAALELPAFDEFRYPSCLEINERLKLVKEEGETRAALDALEAMMRGLK